MTSFSPPEILHVHTKKVACDGSKDDKKGSASAALGHPLIYLDMGKNDYVICPYCSKYFTMQKSMPKLAANNAITKKTSK